MSSSDFVAPATENTSRLGYKHVCINYLHAASHDYQEVIQHTHTHTHPHTHSLVPFFSHSAPTSLSTQIQVENESSNIHTPLALTEIERTCTLSVVALPSLQVSLQVRLQISRSLTV